MLGFFGWRREEEEQQQWGGNRQQTPTLELSMTLMPPHENINHFIHLSFPLQFQTYICICRMNATLGIRFPKKRCSSFLLVKNEKSASWPYCLASAYMWGSFWQELHCPWSGSRSAAQAGGWLSRAAGGIIPLYTRSIRKLLLSLTASCNAESTLYKELILSLATRTDTTRTKETTAPEQQWCLSGFSTPEM